MLGSAGAIVEVEAIEVHSLSALRTIFKIKQEPTGMTYVAAVTVPFAECSFVAKVQCPELGMTGLRDTIVATKLNLHGVSGWMAGSLRPSLPESPHSGIVPMIPNGIRRSRTIH